jgi:hypothetical protein
MDIIFRRMIERPDYRPLCGPNDNGKGDNLHHEDCRDRFKPGIGSDHSDGCKPALEFMLEEEDISACQWAAVTARLLARGFPLESREEHLKVDPGCGVNPGTADLLCENGGWSADLKSGKVRNYMEQQRVYALGFMDRYFVDEWRVYLLFCDERTLVTLDFKRDSAIAETRTLIASIKDPLAVATPCDYCDWCANRWKCPQKLETVAWFLGLDPAAVDLSSITDPERIGSVLALTHAIAKDDGVHDFLKSVALGLVSSGTPIEGWRLQNGQSSESVQAMQLSQLIDILGAPRVLSMMANITGKKFREMWELAKPGEAVPEHFIKTNHGAAFLVKKAVSKAKKTKAQPQEEEQDNNG